MSNDMIARGKDPELEFIPLWSDKTITNADSPANKELSFFDTTESSDKHGTNQKLSKQFGKNENFYIQGVGICFPNTLNKNQFDIIAPKKPYLLIKVAGDEKYRLRWEFIKTIRTIKTNGATEAVEIVPGEFTKLHKPIFIDSNEDFEVYLVSSDGDYSAVNWGAAGVPVMVGLIGQSKRK